MSMANDFLLTPEELSSRRRQRRRRLIWSGAIVLFLVIVICAARPTAHAVKAWQGRRHADKAFAGIAAENWPEAQKEATAAYRLAPNEAEAIRAVAVFLSRVRQPQAFEFWDRLAQKSRLTHADLREETGVALALGETARATTALQTLLAHDGREATAADWLLEAQLSAERGAPNESLSSLEKVFKSAAASSQQQLQAAVLELRVAQEEKSQADAWTRITTIAKGKDAASLDALVLLAQRALAGSREQGAASLERGARSTELADAIDRHPMVKTPQRLLAVDLRMAASPNEKEKLLQSTITRWKNANDDDLLALTKWLNGHGEYARELSTVPLERALQNRDLFLQRLDALRRARALGGDSPAARE